MRQKVERVKTATAWCGEESGDPVLCKIYFGELKQDDSGEDVSRTHRRQSVDSSCRLRVSSWKKPPWRV